MVEGEKRVKILKCIDDSNSFLKCEIEIVEDQNVSKDLDDYATGLVKKYERLLVLNKKDLSEGGNNIKNLKNASQIANNISSNLNIQIFEKQELLKYLIEKKIRKNSFIY